MSLAKTIQAARGDAEADLLLANCRIINVLNGQIEESQTGAVEGATSQITIETRGRQ